MKKTPKKVNKKLNLPKISRTKTHSTKKIKRSPIDYYNCLLTQAQNDWFDPQTNSKKPITACCRDCRLNAPVLNETRNQEIKKLVTSYQQVGDSLKKLLQPLK